MIAKGCFFAHCGAAGASLALEDYDHTEMCLEKALSLVEDTGAKLDIMTALRYVNKRRISQLLIENAELKDRLNKSIEENKNLRKKNLRKKLTLSSIAIQMLCHTTMSLVYAAAGLLGKTITVRGNMITAPTNIGFGANQLIRH